MSSCCSKGQTSRRVRLGDCIVQALTVPLVSARDMSSSGCPTECKFDNDCKQCDYQHCNSEVLHFLTSGSVLFHV